jgi:diguanylate cyclase (GGDEF)-like protein
MIFDRRRPDRRNSLLYKYGSQLGNIVERRRAEAALLAAKQQAETSADVARSAVEEVESANEALTESAEMLRIQANYDPLTRLPNRTLFLDRLAHALSRARRDESIVAVLFIDLDRFKRINDTMGHKGGDVLLKQAAKRLNACVRETDTVARLGGDEFTVILPDLHNAHNTELVARKMLESLAEPFVIDGAEMFVTGSLGITVYPNDGEDAETLLKNADTAMYQGKEDGRNTFRFFTEKMNAEALEYLELENDLRHALDRDELILHYQPIIDLASGRISGAEALLRWNHPTHGIVPPDNFIPVAEDTGLIVPIGEWVFHTACRQMMEWRELGLSSLHVSVNLSARQSRDVAFHEMIKRVLADTDANPETMTLEITESQFMEDDDQSLAVLRQFRDMGINLSLDDFGTGYSSLSYLKRFPVNILKIDRSFVADVVTNEEGGALVEAIIALAHSQHMKVVGEGAETEEQVEFLRSRGCDEVQGFYYSKGVPADEFRMFVAECQLDPADIQTTGKSKTPGKGKTPGKRKKPSPSRKARKRAAG